MKTLFHNLGCSEKEINAFLKMLELGAQPVSVIAKHVGVPRSSMYVILERLKKLQLIEEFERMGITYIKCIPVDSIGDLLKSKEKQLEQTLGIFQASLPQLQAMENKLSITPKVKFFEGKNAVMKMYEQILQEKEFYAAFNPGLVKAKMPEYYYKVAEVLDEKKGKAKELLVASPEANIYKKRFQSDYHQVKILPKEAVFPSDTIICKDKIYMISYGENDVSATEIINKSLAQTQQVLFEQAWKAIA